MGPNPDANPNPNLVGLWDPTPTPTPTLNPKVGSDEVAVLLQVDIDGSESIDSGELVAALQVTGWVQVLGLWGRCR